MRLRVKAVNRGCGGDIKRGVVGVAPSEIGGLLGKNDGSKVMATVVPHPNSAWAGNEKIP